MYKIAEFIERRWAPYKEIFLNGNCYWFAKILQEEFGTTTYYLPVSGHFVAKDHRGIFFDVTGKIEVNEPAIPLVEIEFDDPVWYERLMNDCRH